jgi:hypothetical protein
VFGPKDSGSPTDFSLEIPTPAQASEAFWNNRPSRGSSPTSNHLSHRHHPPACHHSVSRPHQARVAEKAHRRLLFISPLYRCYPIASPSSNRGLNGDPPSATVPLRLPFTPQLLWSYKWCQEHPILPRTILPYSTLFLHAPCNLSTSFITVDHSSPSLADPVTS